MQSIIVINIIKASAYFSLSLTLAVLSDKQLNGPDLQMKLH